MGGGVGGVGGVGGIGGVGGGIGNNWGGGNWGGGRWNGNWSGAGFWGGAGYAGFWNGGWGGYWGSGWGGYWGAPWYATGIGWGLGAWALGSIMYGSGYASYSNPYYVDSGSTAAYYDYSQPITVINQQPQEPVTVAAAEPTAATTVATSSEEPPSPEIQEASSHLDLAQDAFRNGDYAGAAREIDVAIKAMPRDVTLHEFRALVFFATGDYTQAAATLYAVLSAGPGWNWTTVSGLYPRTATYTEQLRELENYVKANPKSADSRFVLAYHYMVCGHTDEAVRQFGQLVKLQPDDQLSAQLAKLLGGDAEGKAAGQPRQANAPVAESPAVKPTAPEAIDAAKLVGKWNARRADGTAFMLELTDDSKFTWRFARGAKKDEFGGKYSVDGAILVLERSDGAEMPGLVTRADRGFNFKLYGGPPDDPGLDFTR